MKHDGHSAAACTLIGLLRSRLGCSLTSCLPTESETVATTLEQGAPINTSSSHVCIMNGTSAAETLYSSPLVAPTRTDPSAAVVKRIPLALLPLLCRVRPAMHNASPETTLAK